MSSLRSTFPRNMPSQSYEESVLSFIKSATYLLFLNRGRVVFFTKKKIHRLGAVNNHAASAIGRELCRRAYMCEEGARGGKIKIVIENEKCTSVLAELQRRVIKRSSDSLFYCMFPLTVLSFL